MLLSVARPDLTREDLVALSIGERDALLLELRRSTFGDGMPCYAKCHLCGEELEYALSAADVLASGPTDRPDAHELDTEHGVLRFRLPNSYDLAALVSCRDETTARRALAERCITHVDGEAPSDVEAICTEPVLHALAENMARCERLGASTVGVRCPECGNTWELVLDVLAYFWQELCEDARRLLHEIHVLARNYGWAEPDILAMSTARRQAYLEMVR
jgi:hypothetical protein